MQALQAFGQATEVRDPLPVRESTSNEADNSGHPFMKLLASLRNAMKQGSELDPDAQDSGSGSKSALLSRGKFLSGVAGSTENGIEGAKGGFLLASGLAVINTSHGMLQAPGQPGKSVVHDLELASTKGKAISSILGQKAAATHEGDARAGAATLGAVKSGGVKTATLSLAGKGLGAAQEAADAQGLVPLDQNNQAGLGSKRLDPGLARPAGSISDVFTRNTRAGSAGNLDASVIAASGGLNGSNGASAANRNHSQGNLRDKSGLATPVNESRTSGGRPARYSVVDLRLKALAAKANTEGQSEGKSAGKQLGAELAESSRSGMSGTDAAGRQISNDHPAGGFTETAKGIGAENSDKAPASFAENLATRLRDGGSLDIVRSAQVILKDGDAGLIRLRLEPESLGGVKIELKMADKQISARIIVESDLAGEAFRSSLDSLRDAFASSGFETSSIEVEVRNGRSGTGDSGRDNSGHDEDGDGSELYLARKAGELGAAVPGADTVYSRYGVIDLVV